MNQITRQLSSFITTLRPKDIPFEALEAAAIGMLDCLAVMRRLSDDELHEKFAACLIPVLGEGAGTRLWSQLRDLPTLPSLRDLDLAARPV